MKKAPFLLLAVPVVAGAIYLRSLASWRPHKVFGAKGEIKHLVFSNDGKTLLVGLGDPSSETSSKLIALDATRGFATKWSYQDGGEIGQPQFYAADTRVLVDRDSIRILDANTGQERRRVGKFRKAAMSPDGKWLVYNGAQPSGPSCIPLFTLSPCDLFIESSTHQAGAIGRRVREGNSLAGDFSFSPDGQTFVADVLSPGLYNRLDFYDVQTWKRKNVWVEIKNRRDLYLWGGTAQWSRDGRFLLSLCYAGRNEAYVNLWRVRDSKRLSSQLLQCATESYGIGSRIVAPSFEIQNDGRVLKFGAGGPVSLSKSTNLNAGFKQLLSLPSETITASTMSPDGSYLIAGTKSGKVVWKRVK